VTVNVDHNAEADGGQNHPVDLVGNDFIFEAEFVGAEEVLELVPARQTEVSCLAQEAKK